MVLYSILRDAFKGVSRVVFSDIDKTMRHGKADPSQETQQAILEFRQEGEGLFIPITGAPLAHVPKFLLEFPLVFAESGAVALVNGERMLVAPEVALRALGELKVALGMSKQDCSSVRFLQGQTVLLEGPRFGSVTLVRGRHPDFPHVVTLPDIEWLEEIVFESTEGLPLSVGRGSGGSYSWIDVRTVEKEHIVAALCDILGVSCSCKVDYFGDGMNDYNAMSLPGVRGHTFSDGAPELQKLVRQSGGEVLDLPGPDGGLAAGLRGLLAKG